MGTEASGGTEGTRAGGWRWDGERWVIDSPDGTQVWDGERWRPAGPAAATPVRRRFWRPAYVAAVLLVAVLVLGSAGTGAWLAGPRLRSALTGNGGRHSPLAGASAGPAAGPSASPSASSASVRAFIPVAEKFVEDHRGLKFKSPVDISFVSDAEFQKRILDSQKQGESDLLKEGKLLRALGLIAPDVDVVKAENSLLSSSVVGYYDPDTKQLVVRGVDASPATRHVLVHELTHALQDQAFSIGKAPATSAADESGEAFLGVVEGDAVRIEQQYIASLPADEQRQAQSQSSASGPPTGVPQVLLEILAFPYQVGPVFIQAVMAAKGQAGLDEAFTNRPTTTAQLLQPQKFLAGVGAAPVAAPAADGPVTDAGVLGELGLILIIEQALSSGRISQAEAKTASLGWAGDRYVSWDAAGQSCVRARFLEDSPASSAVLLKALQGAAAGRAGAKVEGTGPITLTSCA